MPLKLNLSPTLKVLRFGHWLNILPIFVTFAVLKLVASKLVRLKQPLNMMDIFVTLAVSKLDRSNEVHLLQA